MNMNHKRLSNTLLLIGLVFLALFCLVALGVHEKSSWVKHFDFYWIHVIQSHITAGKTAFSIKFTELGNMRLVIALTILLAGWLFYKRRYADGLWLGGTVLFCAAIATKLLKDAFDRERPHYHQLIAKASESFPSGHATGTTVFYGLLALVFFLAARQLWKKLIIAAAGLVWIVSILVSRVYLGVHFPTDVLAGFCFGMASVFISISVYIHLREPLHRMLEKWRLHDKSIEESGIRQRRLVIGRKSGK